MITSKRENATSFKPHSSSPECSTSPTYSSSTYLPLYTVKLDIYHKQTHYRPPSLTLLSTRNGRPSYEPDCLHQSSPATVQGSCPSPGTNTIFSYSIFHFYTTTSPKCPSLFFKTAVPRNVQQSSFLTHIRNIIKVLPPGSPRSEWMI